MFNIYTQILRSVKFIMSKKIKMLCIVLGMLVIKSFSVSASEDTGMQTAHNENELTAVEQAKIYLNESCLGFSKEKLVEKLISEYKLTQEQAEQAANKLEKENPNILNEQALKEAKNYLKDSGISKESLIDRLVKDKFTEEQINYAVKALEKGHSIIWSNQALEAAEHCLGLSIFSREYLINCLKSYKFTEGQVGGAVSALEFKNPNIWNDQALKAAKYYLIQCNDSSREYLIDYLTSYKFTKGQAEKAASKLEEENENIWINRALEAVKHYLKDYNGFSEDSLLELLIYKGFTQDQAESAVGKAFAENKK